MRKCQCCESEYQLQINAGLRQGTKLVDLAREYNVSEDSLSRHRRAHLKATKPKAKAGAKPDLHAEWESIYSALSELTQSTSLQGDSRGVLGSLEARMRSLEAMERTAAAKQQPGNFESLPIPEQVASIRANQPLFVALLDSIVIDAQAPIRQSTDDDAEKAGTKPVQ